MMKEQRDLGIVAFSEPIFCMLQITASWAINGTTVLLWRTRYVSEQYTAALHGQRSHGMVQLRLLRQIMLLSPSLPLPLCSSVSCSTPCLVSVCCFFVFVFFYFILHYFTFLFYFWILLLPTYPSPSFFVCFCLIPVIPLDHQPGSHLLQCHYFLSQPRGLHTKLPICTLPALSGVHGCGGPAEHAPADRNSADLCPARPLPASSHRLPTRLPR